MKKRNSPLFALLLLAILAGLSSCAVNPRCPTALLPIIEVQVNNSASTHDDYIGTGSSSACRARISNVNKFGGGQNFPGGVEVEVRNRKLSTDLNISTTSLGIGAAFFATLPADGSWSNFFIRGNALSTVDKSAILEIATAGISCNEVVLTRKGLMVTGAPPIPNTRPQVEIEVGSVSNLDDYITWSPSFCRMKWVNPPNSLATLGVRVQNMSGTNRLRFSDIQPATGTTAINTTANLTLLGDGTWTSFYVAGYYGANTNIPSTNASTNDKDAVFEVSETSSGNLLAREGIMVRIRKHVNALTPQERDRYLEALREVHETYKFYMLFKDSHSQGLPGSTLMHIQAHGGSAFLPWHRAFVLHLERLIQSSDPSAALPYWHFDVSSPGMFNADFIGSNNATNWVTLSSTNPISTWQIPAEIVGIRRKTPYGNAGKPSVASETATLGLGTTFAAFKSMEVSTHNGAHSTSVVPGSGTWLGDPSIATQDPLFYFLHCNVDRLWAKWQWAKKTLDATLVDGYDRQGSYTSSPTPPGLRLGQYVDDTLWPWDNVTGGTGTAARPATAPLTPFPITLGGLMPGSNPTIKLTVDFRVINFGYDDVFPY